MKHPWTRAETLLFLTPLLVGIGAAALTIGPNALRKTLGLPTELTAQPVRTLTSIALSQNGQLLASAERLNSPSPSTLKIKTIHFWDAHTLLPQKPLIRPAVGNDDTNYGLTISPDGKLLGWSDFGSRFNVCDAKTQRNLWSIKTFTASADFSPDGHMVAFHQGGIRICEAHTGNVVKKWTLLNSSSEGALKFSPKGSWFASSGGRPPLKQRDKAPNGPGGEIELRSVVDWKVKRVFPLPNTDRIAFSPDERSLLGISKWWVSAGASSGSRLRCYNVSSGVLNWEIDSHKQGVNSQFGSIQDVCYSPGGATIAVLPSDNQLFLLDAQTGNIVRTLRVPASQISNCVWPGGLAFSPDGKRLFARGKSAILVWDLE